MTRKLIHLGCFLVVLGLVGRAWGLDADVEVQSPNEPPVIDGLIDEVWSLSTQQFITISIGEGPPDSPVDCSGSWRALYDSEYLYVLVDVNDETLYSDSAQGNSWQDDSVEVYVDGDNSKGGSTDDNDFQYRFRGNTEGEPPTENFHSPGSLEGVEYAVATTDHGYLIEIRLPWSSMVGGPAPAGQLIGIDVFINDDDDGGDSRESQVAWHATGGSGWNTPSMWGTGWLFPGLKASSPEPADGAETVTAPLFRWAAGRTAAFHDIYFGSNPTPGPGEYRGRQPLAWNMYFHPEPLIPRTTYYWRIDEVEADGTTIHTGDVWSFMAAPFEAYNPDPQDGAKWVSLNLALTWLSGANAITHDVYFGTDETQVANGTGGTSKGNQSDALYGPGTLAPDTTYYWRIDERNGTVFPGAVWSFTTVGPYAGARGYYYNWSSATTPPPRSTTFNNLVMTRVDPEINFNWATGSPPGVNADQFAVRWIADLEAEFSEPYIIWTYTDDGIRVWLDGELIIDNWTDHGAMWDSSEPIDLVAGQHYSLVMEWYENVSDARAELYWSSPSISRQIIPAGPLQLPLKASSPDPFNGATGVTETPTLTWKAGEQAARHDVYFGDDRDAVASANTSTAGIYRGRQDGTSYVPPEAPLEWEQTYYWKINEVNGVDLWEGSVWSFTIADYIIVDDFEDYDDYCNRIFYAWEEGGGYNPNTECGILPSNGNGTGSLGGYAVAPYAEQTIVHEGKQAMPFEYLNDGSTGKTLYSETSRSFEPPQDWTRHDVKALTLWFRGYPASVGGFSYDSVTDIYTVTADGWDISGTADGFHYVFKRLSGVGSIQAQVLSVQNTNTWAKAGVMMREDLDPNSAHAMTFVTPGQGVCFEYRPAKGQDNVGDAADRQTGITAPHWVRISRSGNNFTSEHSADGTNWQALGTTQNIPMPADVYVGLALTSHDTALTCEAQFSNVTITGTVTGQWQSQDIGIASNDAEQLYVVVEDSVGDSEVVNHPDPDAILSGTYQEWNIDLKEFSDAGVNLQSISKMYIGVGDRKLPKPGGAGMLYVDDIRLYKPRCIASLLKPDADFSGNCVVDCADLEIMANEWLGSDPGLQADLDTDNDVDFKDYALLVENWLSELLWP